MPKIPSTDRKLRNKNNKDLTITAGFIKDKPIAKVLGNIEPDPDDTEPEPVLEEVKPHKLEDHEMPIYKTYDEVKYDVVDVQRKLSCEKWNLAPLTQPEPTEKTEWQDYYKFRDTMSPLMDSIGLPIYLLGSHKAKEPSSSPRDISKIGIETTLSSIQGMDEQEKDITNAFLNGVYIWRDKDRAVDRYLYAIVRAYSPFESCNFFDIEYYKSEQFIEIKYRKFRSNRPISDHPFEERFHLFAKPISEEGEGTWQFNTIDQRSISDSQLLDYGRHLFPGFELYSRMGNTATTITLQLRRFFYSLTLAWANEGDGLILSSLKIPLTNNISVGSPESSSYVIGTPSAKPAEFSESPTSAVATTSKRSRKPPKDRSTQNTTNRLDEHGRIYQRELMGPPSTIPQKSITEMSTPEKTTTVTSQGSSLPVSKKTKPAFPTITKQLAAKLPVSKTVVPVLLGLTTNTLSLANKVTLAESVVKIEVEEVNFGNIKIAHKRGPKRIAQEDEESIIQYKAMYNYAIANPDLTQTKLSEWFKGQYGKDLTQWKVSNVMRDERVSRGDPPKPKGVREPRTSKSDQKPPTAKRHSTREKPSPIIKAEPMDSDVSIPEVPKRKQARKTKAPVLQNDEMPTVKANLGQGDEISRGGNTEHYPGLVVKQETEEQAARATTNAKPIVKVTTPANTKDSEANNYINRPEVAKRKRGRPPGSKNIFPKKRKETAATPQVKQGPPP